ncbi:cytochrome c maturation protein CcmE [Klebsiella aerogenes]|uniref:Cytochrome c-type biogenesis protein CcmE n=1 Tax=Klebsiella aerogenes TaxID=548 RepID=A0AAP9R258_KLEAE|nr:cytochrome c maturation protein CcmE [Klebsiella aerogenes]QMR43107.1 cytochrome c maturation protein CcmE [Klebsiella aerogenes]
MNNRRRIRLLTVCCLLCVGTIIIALILYALRSGIDLFYTPTEILQGKYEQKQKPVPGQRLRVGGLVMPGSIHRDVQSLRVSFRIYDGRNNVQINYNGILPDLFREKQGVVAQGIYEGNGVISAQQILAKHDENYTPPEITDSLSKTGSHRQANRSNTR